MAYSKFVLKLLFIALFLSNFTIISAQVSKVKIKKTGSRFKVTVNKKTYIINGAGGQTNLEDLKNIGGNTIRTWGTENAQQILDEAQKNGIMVMMGLWVQHERHGFDYNDEMAIKKQLEGFRLEIQKYKNHPALLFWCVGNEYELGYTNTKVWKAVNDIVKMVKTEDKNHPVVTVTAGINDEKIKFVQENLHDIDILGINTYGDIGNVKDVLNRANFTKPYMITEWGPTGHWECAKTSWGVSIEQTSKEKAASYLKRFTDYIKSDSNQCVGSFAFLWGQKQEYTSTWYGIFSENGQKTEVYDALASCWSPDLLLKNHAPSLDSLSNSEDLDFKDLKLTPNKEINFEVFSSDMDNDKLSYSWNLYLESSDLKAGGDAEAKPQEIKNVITNNSSKIFTLSTPLLEGKYRLFITVSDGEKIAYANVPIYVTKP